MGSFGILVIGDDHEDQLDRFQDTCYAEPENKHWVTRDRLESTRLEYMTSHANNAYSDEGFLSYARNRFNIRVLEAQQEPDLRSSAFDGGVNTNGWIRVSSNGEVIELIHRFIPYERLFTTVIGESPHWPLKQTREDAIRKARENAWEEWEWRKGKNWLRYFDVEPQAMDSDEITFVASAKKDDIDFELMRKTMWTEAGKVWDCAAAVSDKETLHKA